jgi:hypothetical protein
MAAKIKDDLLLALLRVESFFKFILVGVVPQSAHCYLYLCGELWEVRA